MVFDLLNNIWLVFLDTAFWLIIGLLFAGLIRSYISENAMQRWVGGNGIGSILRAALFGAPLPLCSCGVLPAAIGMRRAGASKEATVAFLISTPETSIDSVAVTYALMGPVMAIFRPLAALFNAIGTGLLTTFIADDPVMIRRSALEAEEVSNLENCCEVESCSAKEQVEEIDGRISSNVEKPKKWLQVISYAGADLLDDISKWMAIGIVLAGIMLTFIPPDWFAQWGHGFTAMLLMLVVGVPMYICAVASTPIAAGLLLAGVSPGAVLVFLLVGPATNIASFALLKQELGFKVTAVYLAGLSVLSLMMGLVLEWMLDKQQWQIMATLGEAHAVLPDIVVWSSAFILIFLAIKPLRRAVIPQLG